MQAPPLRQIHLKEPAMQVLTVGKVTALNEAASAPVVLEGSFDSHALGILADAFGAGFAI